MSLACIVFNRYRYDAFGKIVEKIEYVLNSFYYSGYQYDSKTGLYYLRSRYYNPETARFITEDSFTGYYTDPLSLNKYTYCHNNPISYHDPDGFASTGWWWWLAAAVVVAALVVATIVTAGGAAAGIAAIAAAANGIAVASTATTVLAFASIGAGLGLTAVGILASIDAVDTYSSTKKLDSALDTFGDYGPAAAISTITGGALGAGEGYLAHKAQYPKTSKIETQAESLTPAEQARKNQENSIGKKGYTGVDDWTDTTLQKGDTVWGGQPGQSEYYTTDETIKIVGNNSKQYYDGLQIPHDETRYGLRREFTVQYEVVQETVAAKSIAQANPNLGTGGFEQLFIPEYKNSLKEVFKLTMLDR